MVTPAAAATTRTAVVAGDITIDWNIATSAHPGPSEWAGATMQPGGAALLAAMVGAVSGKSGCQVQSIPAPVAIVPGDPRFNHSYATWQQMEAVRGGKGRAWRVSQAFGATPASAAGTDSPDGTLNPDLVVIDDAGLGFRERTRSWPAALTTKGVSPRVLVKMSAPVADGTLWSVLASEHAERLTVLVNADDLRRADAQISTGISWERTAEEIVREVALNPRINGLSRAMHVVVSLGTSGAVLVARTADGRPSATLVFDHRYAEGEWARERPGGMIGLTACLGACLAVQLLSPAPDIAAGIRAGLSAMRRAHEAGYGRADSLPGRTDLGFPLDSFAAPEEEFAVAEIPDRGGRPWRILERRAGPACPPDVDALATTILLDGHEDALSGVPVGVFGELVSIDRAEIESLNRIRNLIEEYLRGLARNPLSIGVFGPPGSGKSFAVKQVARSLGLPKEDVLEFNLTQLSDERDLPVKFHEVRDRVLAGATPLVFWDEFDTRMGGRELGWLERFLAPMADGMFGDGGTSRPIGRAIFVFAGGTEDTRAEFDHGERDEAFRSVKGPDFLRRLADSLDALGPNRQGDAARGEDPYFIVRRALILRSSLARREPRLFSAPKGRGRLRIDPGVLRALLNVPEYRHGSGSIDAILRASSLAGRSRFDRSCLPQDSTLGTHVNAGEFGGLMEQLELEGKALEQLAEDAHRAFCDGKRRDGWTYGPQRKDARKVHNLLVDYADLPETYKEANRATVRNIPRKLAAAGLAMTPAKGAEPLFVPTEDEIERMAMVEHELWMGQRMAAGFTKGPDSSVERTNPNLVPWKELPESIRAIDRDLVRGIPAQLAGVGYAVRRVDRT